MRPIKFRAWHKTWRNELGSGMNLVKGLWWGKSGIGHVHLTEWADSTLLSEVELMQFTGLLDKNGKEIYEGDMLGTDGDAKFPVYKTGIVVFEKGAFTLKPFYQTDERFEFRDELKIIGNIYENPELI